MGPDEVHPRILKEAATVLAPSLHTLFRLSLATGSLPATWNEATVIPIYKSGDRLNPVSFRPISLTSVPCKMLERLIKRSVMQHLQQHNLISPSQHGFVPGRSCITNLLMFMDSLTQAHDDGLITDAVFFDFAKAFDKVPHAPLLAKLESYGIHGEALLWIASFLTGRSFRVRVDSVLSSSSPVSSGVPQGSVLGPILFLIYINDLPEVLSSNCLLYADDLKIWNSDDPNILQQDTDAVKHWSEEWHLPLNLSKCAHMSLGGDSGNLFVFHDERCSLSIPSDMCRKDLGVLIDTSLSFSHHTRATSAKAYRTLKMIKRTFPSISKSEFHILFGTYVRPLLKYANSVVYTLLKKYIGVSERIQRAATKMVHGMHRLDYSSRMSLLDLYPLDQRRLRGDLILAYSFFHFGQSRGSLHLFSHGSSKGTRQEAVQASLSHGATTEFFSIRVISPWNALPPQISQVPSLPIFKHLIYIHLGLRRSTSIDVIVP